MSELTPITRVESYLDAIVNNGIPPTEDITRIETFLQAIYDNQVCALTPITRIEMFLGKISGQDIVLPEPITRIELYLAAIAGEDVELPENPITRLEMYLAEWADSGDWTTISGAIVEFITQRAHKLKSCVVSLKPQQDLHGYDSPWPAGGGENLIDDTVKTVVQNNYLVIGAESLTEYPFHLKTGTYTMKAFGVTAAFGYMKKYDDPDTTVVINGTSSGTVTITTEGDYRIWFYGSNYINQITGVMLVVGSTAPTAYSPFSNICPISGWTGCEVTRTGKNLLNLVESEMISSGWNRAFPISIKEGTYVISCQNQFGASSLKGARVSLCDADGNRIKFMTTSYDFGLTEYVGIPTTVTEDQASKIERIVFECRAGGVTFSDMAQGNLQLELDSTASDYEPFRGNSYQVTFGETVYGGTPDIVSGEMPVTMRMVDLGSLTWTKTGSGSQIFFYVSLPNGSKDDTSLCVCSMYKTAKTALEFQDNDKICRQYGSEYWNFSRICIKDSAYNDSTVTEFKAAMQGVQLVYMLGTPVDITITPTPITALKGYNAMWSDAGDIEVTVHGTPVEVSTQQALNMLLGGAYRNNQTADDVSDDEALDIILGGENR